MIPRPAQYLLRFDDLCPTMNRTHWSRFERLIADFGLKPILAIVSANADPELIVDPPDPAFWPRMRTLESAGAAIALHGYTHVCTSTSKSLLPLHERSEFAGVTATLQRQWIQAGLEILHSHGLRPRLFVAPRHGFDRNTLLALQAEGIGTVSDGFARIPHIRAGLAWIPQQLWAPVLKPAGLWTICIHPNTASDASIEQLRAFLEAHAAQFTSLDRILSELPLHPLSAMEKFHENALLWRFIARRRIRAVASRLSPGHLRAIDLLHRQITRMFAK